MASSKSSLVKSQYTKVCTNYTSKLASPWNVTHIKMTTSLCIYGQWSISFKLNVTSVVSFPFIHSFPFIVSQSHIKRNNCFPVYFFRDGMFCNSVEKSKELYYVILCHRPWTKGGKGSREKRKETPVNLRLKMSSFCCLQKLKRWGKSRRKNLMKLLKEEREKKVFLTLKPPTKPWDCKITLSKLNLFRLSRRVEDDDG